VFQDFKLVHGTWDVRSPEGKLERVRPQDITGTCLLTVEGELDDISGVGQTKAAHALCKGIGRREGDHIEVEGAGHYGIFSGRRWRTTVYPQVKAFIGELHAKSGLPPTFAPASSPAPAPAQRALNGQRAAPRPASNGSATPAPRPRAASQPKAKATASSSAAGRRGKSAPRAA
jgi:poly(3-hydroxybutyrate) depolymerase